MLISLAGCRRRRMNGHGRKSCTKSNVRRQHSARKLLWTRGRYWVAEDKKSAGNNLPDETPKVSGVVSRTGKDRPQIGLFTFFNPPPRTRQELTFSGGYPIERMARRVSTRNPSATSRGPGKTASSATNTTILLIYLVLIFTWSMPSLVESQHRVDSPLFEEKIEAAEAELMYMLQGGDYAKDTFFPERQYPDADTYVYRFPDAADYSIGIIVDPCKGNTFDCCHRLYGSPEYPKAARPDGSSYRVVDKYLFADEAEILSNTIIVDQEGRTVPKANSRFADDEIVIDENCTAEDVPDSSCVGFRQRMQRSPKVPPCTDNNQTVNAETSCQDLTGGAAEFCLAVGYSQTAISFTCGGDHAEDPHCGTFLELHVAQANPYVGVEEVVSEVRIRTSNVSGYTTTTIPTRWKNESSKVICAYEHASLLVGTMVLITEGAPVCCCPGAFSLKDRLGSFICPIHASLEGPYAPPLKTISQELAFEDDLSAYPLCPAVEEDKDMMMVSGYSAVWDRFFTREAEPVESIHDTSGYTSSDLTGHYDAACGYFLSCGAAPTAGSCSGDDRSFTFAGRVGKITSVPDDPENEQYGVTFNDGRTTYFFNQEHLRIEHDYNFEVWWVQRTLYNFRVQARKPFTVASPTCSFDSTNGQYFPFAILDEGGEFVD